MSLVASLLRSLALVCVVLGASAPVSLATQAPHTGPYAVRAEYDRRVPMRDGITLSADVYRPATPGRFPVILERTPYDNSRVSRLEIGRFLASHGYVYVTQDVRGRGDSDGSFYPLRFEVHDGYDTQTWAGTQPWSAGTVGTTGASYMGWTQVYPGGLNNPYLGAMVAIATPPDPVRNFPFQFGAISPSTVSWVITVSGRTLQDISQLDLTAAYRLLPLRTIDSVLGWQSDVWRDWFDHPTLDAYWREQAYQDRLLDARVPILHVSGWYDDVLVGTLENYVGMTRHARDVATRARQHLLIGPWGHRVNTGRQLGPIDFGPTAVIDLKKVQLQWFDRWLMGIDNGVDTKPPVRIFVMGENVWRDEWEWPLARTAFVNYYLHSGGQANTAEGDGILSRSPPTEEPPDRYRYDPADPVPFITEPEYSQLGGPDDYRPIEQRHDVLVFTGPALEEPLEVCGPLRVVLYASSSARDTDWIARVVNVHPGGYAQRLNEGVVRARFRSGLDRERLLTPGRVEAYTIDAWATCILLARGHRLRVEISSSAFPRFDTNLNTGGPIGWEERGVVAEQTVYHDRDHPSHLIVPVVPRER
jgi:putative CocE/NonD family hydrolase